jgi:hypothetical protein
LQEKKYILLEAKSRFHENKGVSEESLLSKLVSNHCHSEQEVQIRPYVCMDRCLVHAGLKWMTLLSETRKTLSPNSPVTALMTYLPLATKIRAVQKSFPMEFFQASGCDPIQ